MLAIIAVTVKGAGLAGKLAALIETPADIYLKDGLNSDAACGFHSFNSLSEIIADIFGKYDGIIFILAAGIAVRVIAPHIKDKRIDPAVVVLDDGGKFAISLLSGHIGGANSLTKKIAQTVGAVPVITTATDVAGLLSADTLAAELNLSIEPFSALKVVNAAIANGRRVVFFTDTSASSYSNYSLTAGQYGVAFKDIKELDNNSHYDAAVIVADQDFALKKPHVYLRTNSLAVGVGCRFGASPSEILAAIGDACQKIGRNIKNVVIIGSTVYKKQEQGLLAAGREINVPIKFFTNEELSLCISKHNFKISAFVKEKIGVGNVCEPAAVLAGRTEKLILPKTKYANVTIAIAIAKVR